MMPISSYRPYLGARARDYERLRRQQPQWAAEDEIVRAAVRTMERGARVLDVPVGTGRFLGIYQDAGLEVIGVDESPDMLAEAAKKGTAAQLLQVDATNDLADAVGEVDYAICLRLANWLTPEEWTRVLEGLIAITRRAVWIGLHTSERAGVAAASSMTQSGPDLLERFRAAGWRLAEIYDFDLLGLALALGGTQPARRNGMWEFRRDESDR